MEEDSTALVEDTNPSEPETINFDSDAATTTENVEETINLDVENTFEKEEMKPLASSSLKEVTEPAETTFDKEVELPSEETKPLASSSEHEIAADTTFGEEVEVTDYEDMKPLATSSLEDVPAISLAGEGDEGSGERLSFEQTGEDGEPLALSTKEEVEKSPFAEEKDELPPIEDEFKPLASSSLKDVKEGEGDPRRASIDIMKDIEMTRYSDHELPVEELKTGHDIFGQTADDYTLPTLFDSSSISLVSSMGEEEEESETISIFAELGLGLKPQEPINRKELEEEYLKQKELAKFLRRKNGIFHKRIRQYYERRKILTVFAYEDSEELSEKYESKLEELYELRNKTIREKEAVDNELKDMMLLRDEQLEELEMNFEVMQDREFEIGHGLIDLRTGKVISDKTIEKLLKRQKLKCEEIAKIRLAYIKKRDIVRGMEQELKSLETIGGSLNLMDIEQLRMENQTFLEKIEEREEEVMNLRERHSRDIIQVGHIREKLNIIEVEIDDIGLERQNEIQKISKTRKELNGLKIKRDKTRSDLEVLKQSTGLLNYPKLLGGMATDLKKVEELQDMLAKLKEVHELNRVKLNNIRANMQQRITLQRETKVQPKKRIPIVKQYKKRQPRPTLTYDTTARVLYFNKNMNKNKKNSKSHVDI